MQGLVPRAQAQLGLSPRQGRQEVPRSCTYQHVSERSAGTASTSGRTMDAAAAGNGRQQQTAPPPPVRQPQQDTAALWTQVQELRTLCNAQQEAMQQQSAAIQQLQQQLQRQQLAGNSNPQDAQAAPGVWRSNISPFAAQAQALQKHIPDRRAKGLFDARFHSTRRGAIPNDFRVLPERIILVRHAESEGNVDNALYTFTPDSQVPLTERGQQQARDAGQKIRHIMEQTSRGGDYQLFFYTSPYKRSLQTYEGIRQEFASAQVAGFQEEVQLREQDFGNFQNEDGMRREKLDRTRFGRFYYRFPNGESGADVYDRITIFEDHLTRDINAGRFSNNTSVVLVTHGLALRIILMRWFHWRVDQFLNVYNPPNAEPIVLERFNPAAGAEQGLGEEDQAWLHTKSLYRLTPESISILKGCTEDMGCDSLLPPGVMRSWEEWEDDNSDSSSSSSSRPTELCYDEHMWQ